MDKDLITAIIAAIFGGLVTLTPVAIGAWIKFRNSENKWKVQFATMKTDHEKKLMEARAEFKKETDGSNNLTKLIDGLLEQASGIKDLAESMRGFSTSINDNTAATNRFGKIVDEKFDRLGENVDDFAARLVKATKTMEETNGEIQKASNQIVTSSQDIQKNSQTIGDNILEQLAALKATAEETLKIVTEIDTRVKQLEAKPDPIPPPPPLPVIPIVMKVEPQDTPAPPPASAVVDTHEAQPAPKVGAQHTTPSEENKSDGSSNVPKQHTEGL